MLKNLEPGGELGVIHARRAKVGFGGCFPLLFVVPHLFRRPIRRVRDVASSGMSGFGGHPRTPVALGVGS